ncbi:translocation/assembly module TamB domain-containing protein [Paracoccus sp. 11-3]|uniref:Translocation/assembly module TamB domain-containing protein n=1 Tax=Paracoccus amoyensis TaxID=2760093 RepID=A0A926G878_9RHOB|nr:translocation/assembly module TamB domain-containing protein [Paracoccus amoyensis]MBC9246288.1 translocation/assembly module TamB domain-containing protein [Paracoccus amoyensis]
MRKIWLVLFSLLFPAMVWAQSAAEISEQVDDDRGFLTNLLERNLSGAGRSVVIDGFEGALSSRATFDRITISDDDGVWLTLNNGAIQWTRSALLRGRVQIAELSAEEILLPRLPGAGDEVPQAETREFALPELPVSLNIDKITAQRVQLGEPVIGVAGAISVDGSMNLDGGEGHAQMNIQRLDGPRGEFVLDTGYSNSTKILKLNLNLDEDADGILVNMVDLYGKPSVDATISGEGAITDFVANIELATDGQPRITGQISATGANGPDGSPGTQFNFNLGGDVASLLSPDNRAFFGTNTQLKAQGWRGESGRMEIPELTISTEALSMDGSLSTNDQGAPQSANMLITLGRDAGATEVPVALPFAGDGATVETGRVTLEYDASKGSGWKLTGNVGQLNMTATQIGSLDLNGAGEVALNGGALEGITGNIQFGGTEIAFTDPGLRDAVGNEIRGSSDFDFTPGNAVEFSNLRIDGTDYGMTGYFLVSGLGSGITLSLETNARYDDLSRLSTISGRKMTGRADVALMGYYVMLTRGFDIDATVTGNDISMDQDQVDRLLSGESTIELAARRDERGIELDHLTVNAERLTAEAKGFLNSDASDVTATISMPSLEGADPDFSGELLAEAKLTGPDGQRRLTIDGQATDLRLGIDMLDNALQGRTELNAAAQQSNEGFTLKTFSLSNPQLNASGEGRFTQGTLDATTNFAVPDLSVLQSAWTGGFQAQAKLTERDGTRFIDLTGTGSNLSLGQKNAAGTLTGETKLTVQAEEKGGVITLRDVQMTNDQMNATAQGVYGDGVTDVTANVDIRSFAFMGPGWRGSLRADASFKEAAQGQRRLELTGTGRDLAFGQAQIDGALAGETRLTVVGAEQDGVFIIEQAQVENPRLAATATGRVGGGQSDVTAHLDAQDLRFLGNGISGAVTADAHLIEEDGTRRITAKGQANGLSVRQAQADALLAGRTTFDVAATQGETGISVQRLIVENPQLQVRADGDTTSGMNVAARLSDLALLKPEFPGPVEVDGTVREDGSRFIVDLNTTAPGDTRLNIAGTAARDFSTADLAITGTGNASIANSSLRTRSIQGPVRLDLRLNGRPSLNALSGRVELTNASISDPGAGIAIEGLNATADLNGGRIMVNAAGQVEAGGRIEVTGPVDLNNGTALDLVIILDGVIARDPNLYETEINGRLTMVGNNASGPLISGRIDLGTTEFRIPSTGFGGAKEILDIEHIGDTRPVRATRAKAGLEEYPSQASIDAGMAAPPSTPPSAPPRLDLFINAPQQVFVRGRGVDAELGGTLQVRGTTRNVIPIGHLELIRGRVDLLGKRFDLTEGLVELQGSMIPVIRLVAESNNDGITTRIIIDGEVRNPDINFQSSPEMPEEEVLSQLLFGRGLDNISALQAAQLANAVAVLAGRGGIGVIGNLRSRMGLDDLDLATDDDGNVQLRAGKYISDNVYTDVSVGDDGKSAINLNLDISDSLRARGSVGSDGDSSIGLFFERDY